ncbi:MAG: hypothetical protein KAT68_08640 [Bacteroidales bacterium]|nr:hypothetical protein [Bacteroidales bacterium]
MIKKIGFPIIIIAIIIMGIFSCEKTEFTEEDAQDNQVEIIKLLDSLMQDSLLLVDSLEHVWDSLYRIGGNIQYTLKVISAGDAGILKSTNNSIIGVTVVISEHGKVDSAVTDESGTVVFDSLRIGTMNVNVKAENFTELNFVTEITVPSNNNNDFESIDRSVANMVVLFPLTGESLATISGQITIDTDLTNTSPEKASDVLITASIDVEDGDFRDRFVDNYNHTDINPSYFGRITHIAYSDIVMRATTNANGEYSIQVPSTADELGLAIKIQLAEIAQDQTLFMVERYEQELTVANVEQTVRTLFSSDFTGVGDVSTIPTVDPCYVIFAAPTGSDFMQPTVLATAVAHIGESGIEAINITNQGLGYTQAPQVIITSPTGSGATATATVTDGKVTEITIIDEGLGYQAGTTTIDLSTVVDDIATADAEVTYSIVDFNVTTQGAGYTSIPDVDINSAGGSGAVAVAVMDGYVNEITLTAGGSNYTTAPTILIAGGNGYGATATATMSTFNTIKDISVMNYTVDTFTVAHEVLIVSAGTGSGAKATTSLSSAGNIRNIVIDNVGAGYIEAPTVTISGGGGYGASAHATIAAGSLTGIIIDDAGTGFTSNPTISITAAPTGGTNATAHAIRGFTIASINLTNNGNGYDFAANVDVQLRYDDTQPYTSAMNGTYDGSIPTVTLNMSVRSVAVANGGQDFTSNPTVTFIPVGNEGSGASATASIAYKVEEIILTDQGSGYRSAMHTIYVTIDAPPEGGTQAVATAVEGNGILNALTITNPGAEYTAVPIVELTGGGGATVVQADVSALITGGEVTGFTINDPGQNYTADPTVTIKTYENAAVANATVSLTAGQIEWIEVTNPGEGYTVAPSIEIIPKDNGGNSVIPFGTGASATAIIGDNGTIIEIIVDEPGTGYYRTPEIKLTIPAYNTTAEGWVNVNDAGAVTAVSITEEGMGYIEVPAVTFVGVNGVGSGATGIARIEGGKVKEVIMSDGGSGYLSQNTPGNFGNVGNHGSSINGKPFKIYGNNSNPIIVKCGQYYIRDMYLGTGKRIEEY